MLPAVGHLSLCAVIYEAGRQPGSFYRVMLCMRGTSHGPVSVCLRLSQAGVLLKRLNTESHK